MISYLCFAIFLKTVMITAQTFDLSWTRYSQWDNSRFVIGGICGEVGNIKIVTDRQYNIGYLDVSNPNSTWQLSGISFPKYIYTRSAFVTINNSIWVVYPYTNDGLNLFGDIYRIDVDIQSNGDVSMTMVTITIPDKTYNYYHSAVGLRTIDGSIWIFGGKDGETRTQTTLRLDTEANTITSNYASFPQFMEAAGVCYHQSSDVFYIFGGINGIVFLTSIYKYDVSGDNYTPLSATLARGGISIQCVPYNDRIYILSGSYDGAYYLYTRLFDAELETVIDTGADSSYMPCQWVLDNNQILRVSATIDHLQKYTFIGDLTTPTSDPTSAPISAPTTTPTAMPMSHPTTAPTTTPATTPTATPTGMPLSHPTSTPSEYPTVSPSAVPFDNPTINPTVIPSLTPVAAPSRVPSQPPLIQPTIEPTEAPTLVPTTLPTISTSHPTSAPISAPTSAPISAPTTAPTEMPLSHPTSTQSEYPTVSPSVVPFNNHTINPTAIPSRVPSQSPLAAPTIYAATELWIYIIVGLETTIVTMANDSLYLEISEFIAAEVNYECSVESMTQSQSSSHTVVVDDYSVTIGTNYSVSIDDDNDIQSIMDSYNECINAEITESAIEILIENNNNIDDTAIVIYVESVDIIVTNPDSDNDSSSGKQIKPSQKLIIAIVTVVFVIFVTICTLICIGWHKKKATFNRATNALEALRLSPISGDLHPSSVSDLGSAPSNQNQLAEPGASSKIANEENAVVAIQLAEIVKDSETAGAELKATIGGTPNGDSNDTQMKQTIGATANGNSNDSDSDLYDDIPSVNTKQ